MRQGWAGAQLKGRMKAGPNNGLVTEAQEPAGFGQYGQDQGVGFLF